MTTAEIDQLIILIQKILRVESLRSSCEEVKRLDEVKRQEVEYLQRRQREKELHDANWPIINQKISGLRKLASTSLERQILRRTEQLASDSRFDISWPMAEWFEKIHVYFVGKKLRETWNDLISRYTQEIVVKEEK